MGMPGLRMLGFRGPGLWGTGLIPYDNPASIQHNDLLVGRGHIQDTNGSHYDLVYAYPGTVDSIYQNPFQVE